MTIIPENFIGVVESRDGEPLNDGDIIGKHVDCDMYQDARAFLIGGGQRGPQGLVIPEGSYRINTFVVPGVARGGDEYREKSDWYC